MYRIQFNLIRLPLRVAIVLAAIVAATTAHPLAQVFTGVSLKVSKEVIPPGGMAQVKVFVTEPKPISTAGGFLSFDGLEGFDGIAINSPADDTFGVAVVNGGGLAVSIVSKSASFGTGLDYPVLTVAGRVPAFTPLGARFPMTIDPASLRLLDPLGVVYPSEIKDGYVEAARGVSIDDVLPGSADLPAGAVVTVRGTGFVPRTRIQFNGVKLAKTSFIDSTRIDVVLATPARMHGTRVRAVNPNGSKVTYYSYQRTARVDPSAMPVFRDAVPLFPHRSALSAIIDLSGVAAGLALQNIEPSSATVVVRLFGADGALLATTRFVLPANAYLVQEVPELFQMAAPAGAFVRVRASGPVQAMGIAVDAAGTATPLLPR